MIIEDDGSGVDVGYAAGMKTVLLTLSNTRKLNPDGDDKMKLDDSLPVLARGLIPAVSNDDAKPATKKPAAFKLA